MEELFILREKLNDNNRFNAGSKAREDVDTILLNMGARPLECGFDFTDDRSSSNMFQKISYHLQTAMLWKLQGKTIPSGSTVVVQFPVRAHTVFFSMVISSFNKKNIKTIAIVHDLDTLRNVIYYGKNIHGFRLAFEEVNALKKFDMVIAHNSKMKDVLIEKFGVDSEKLVSLGIFDYLISGDDDRKREEIHEKPDSIIVAGNLDIEKCGYAYKLSAAEPMFELYGANYNGDYASNVHYNGVFLPDELPLHLQGGYGLVWDGEETDKCSGIFGEYLKINNPHKTSLYLACGIPVIIWKQAAIADFVKNNKCGIVVDSIADISDKIRLLSLEEYINLKHNAELVGRKLRDGYFTERAVKFCLEKLKGKQ